MFALGHLGNSRHDGMAGDASLKPILMLPPFSTPFFLWGVLGRPVFVWGKEPSTTRLLGPFWVPPDLFSNFPAPPISPAPFPAVPHCSQLILPFFFTYPTFCGQLFGCTCCSVMSPYPLWLCPGVMLG